jgi:hypothetical protein
MTENTTSLDWSKQGPIAVEVQWATEENREEALGFITEFIKRLEDIKEIPEAIDSIIIKRS